MQYIRTSRRNDTAIPDFDIFDILHYSEIVEMLFGTDEKYRPLQIAN